MLVCVEKRFGDVKTLQPVEWLSDNGSCYTARETITFAAALGIVSKFTQFAAPSNGMAELLVKTFKVDYVFCNDRPGCRNCDVATPAGVKTMRMLAFVSFPFIANLECPL